MRISLILIIILFSLLTRVSGDMILFEVSYNTIEFAFAKASRIAEVEETSRHLPQYDSTVSS